MVVLWNLEMPIAHRSSCVDSYFICTNKLKIIIYIDFGMMKWYDYSYKSYFWEALMEVNNGKYAWMVK